MVANMLFHERKNNKYNSINNNFTLSHKYFIKI